MWAKVTDIDWTFLQINSLLNLAKGYVLEELCHLQFFNAVIFG
jgi:hypothetical protein